MISSEAAQDNAAATVTFTLAHSGLDGLRVAVVGDFNGWDPAATPMDGLDGAYTATVTLPPGRYRFRYLSEDGRWFNDDAADDYADNDHGGQDSVVEIPDGSAEAPDDTDPDAFGAHEPLDAVHEPLEATRDTAAAADLSEELELALEQDRSTDQELRERDEDLAARQSGRRSTATKDRARR